MAHLTLLIHCKDQKGIIASVTNFILDHGGNTTYIDQHVDAQENVFFMRLECFFEQADFNVELFTKNFAQDIGDPFEMQWQLYPATQKLQMAIFVSKYDHCLYDILGRYNAGELQVHIPFIVSNHKDLAHIAANFDIPFYHIPVTKGTKALAEQRQLDLLRKFKVDFIVLARYMQIVTPTIISEYTHRIINIHHSFLPAFVGAKPYHAAFARGVKIIGTTSHYVTEELDAGPIIEQDTIRVTHSHTIPDLIAKGRDLEKIVLSRAIKLHAQHKCFVYDNKTVIFT
ncbi:formyltetrahydrofolate deformylase [Dokdonia sp. Hel_I_63]|uniref:formyltetrahydrofolate deformylase n=1 Tax=Dokdonia sp. Hel_I_63 TaxID=1249996 RepID=UPI00119B88D0|nr:formyltetrahydrofolate deformylase [Dokdonia sp. Hel_I_63]TVZ22645.1 formyltetrahydrofolate deformylase [Dokdonia sp. Hel_I_63]